MADKTTGRMMRRAPPRGRVCGNGAGATGAAEGAVAAGVLVGAEAAAGAPFVAVSGRARASLGAGACTLIKCLSFAPGLPPRPTGRRGAGRCRFHRVTVAQARGAARHDRLPLCQATGNLKGGLRDRTNRHRHRMHAVPAIHGEDGEIGRAHV